MFNRYKIFDNVDGKFLEELVTIKFWFYLINKLFIKDIRIVATDAARRFFDENSLSQIVYTEADEWNMWQNRGDPILHIGI